MTDAYIGIGSNIGPKENIRRCISILRSKFDVFATSPIYETKPYGYEKQPNFWNFAVGIKTELNPPELLKRLQSIENSLGRKRAFRFNPRTIDLDILLYGSEEFNNKNLSIPHKGLVERDFMLVPLIDIAPDAVHPTSKKKIKYLKKGIKQHQILRRLDKI